MDNDKTIIPMPGLYENYIEQGTRAVEEQEYEAAEQCFKTALLVEPDGIRARFGYILSLYQNGKLAEAKSRCESFICDEIGDIDDYFDALHVYASILRDLGETDQAAAILKMTLQNQDMPSVETAEKFRQWLRLFLENAKQGTTAGESDRETVPGEDGFLDEEKWSDAKQLLTDPDCDPYVKSLLLKDLKADGLKKEVSVHKLGQTLTVDLGTLPDNEDDDLYQSVRSRLEQLLESENPTLYEMALQLWDHFTMTLYPIALSPRRPELWAAAVYVYVHEINGMQQDANSVAVLHEVSASELAKTVEYIDTVETSTSF